MIKPPVSLDDFEQATETAVNNDLKPRKDPAHIAQKSFRF